MIKMTTFARITLGATAVLVAFPLSAGAQAPTPAAPAAGTVTLRYKFTPGQVHRYKVTINMVGTMMTGQSGAGFPINTATQFVLKQTVKDVRATDGAATISTEIESTRFAMNGQEQTVPDAQQTAMKKPTTLLLLPTGKVLPTPAADTPELSMSAMDFSKAFLNLITVLPEGPVKAGDTWESTLATPGMAGSDLKFASTLTALTGEGDAARASIDQKINGVLQSMPGQPMPMGIKITGTITGTGTVVFNTAAGLVESMTNNSDVGANAAMNPKPGQAVPPGMPTGMKIQMRQKTTMERLPDVATAPAK